MTSIPILENPSKEYLFDTLIPSRQPAILRGLNIGNCVEDWKNIEYLKKKCGDKIVSIREFTTENLDFLNKNYEFKNVTFSEMLDLILQSPEVQKMRYYFRSIGENPRKEVSNVDKFSPELSADFKIPIQFESIKEKLFSSILRISSQRIRVWTHYDVMDNILCQVTGDKEITLWPPSDVPYLYVVGSTSSVLDIENPDLLKFPKFQYASPMKGVLKPGDVLFLPSLWFHNTITQTPSISINIFWKHLPDDQYWLKDLYGNRDPIIAEKCLEDLANCIQNIQKMPPHYSNFYLRKMKEMIDAKLNE
uniref:JmjC domain-containing protein n=1 Tax=Arcella intermedia TaxID=1963864 RepID=A0A6B2LB82_9EUKA